VEGKVNEFAAVIVNGQTSELRADAAAGGYRFRTTIPVTEGNNTVTIKATDPQQTANTKPVYHWPRGHRKAGQPADHVKEIAQDYRGAYGKPGET